jgi:transposase
MKKNSKIDAGKKLETVNEVEGAKTVKKDVRRLLRKLDQITLESEQQKAAASCSKPVAFNIGLDLGDRKTRYCILDHSSEYAIEGRLATTKTELHAYFSQIPRSRIALEVGTHSPWVDAILRKLGHEVHVANPRKMEGIYKNKRKNDRFDALLLARYARADIRLLYPIRHRGVDARQDLVILRARDRLVCVRTKLVNSVRGLVKSMGERLPKCSAQSFHKIEAKMIPEGIRAALLPLVEQIGSLTEKIVQYDKTIHALAAKKYPETELLQQVKGVGDLTSLAFVLILEDPEFFAKSRDVGPYLGMIPKQDESGDSSPQLRITKTGDRFLRKLLVGSAQYILGAFGPECDLRTHGLKLAQRGGKNAKKRAVVAVARKLAVLLHSMWRNGEVYEPLRQATLMQALEQKAMPAAVNA